MSDEHLNPPDLTAWVGKTIEIENTISAKQANLMNATLDRAPDFKDGDTLPPAWHWLFFHEGVKGSGLGIEGHPKLGGFMPPVPLPRRMWAGGSLIFDRPIVIGQPAVKRSRIASIVPKSGKSGELYFVTLEHEIFQNTSNCLHEKQVIVYREPADPTKTLADPPAAPQAGKDTFSAEIRPDPIMLFRYSALTFNGHRIHYDLDFCQTQEGYPNLVFHGPLTATLLLDLFQSQYPAELIKTFEYRGISPLFNPDPFTVNGTRKGVHGKAWAANPTGGLAMSAQVGY